jgi:hypothetical protein
LIVCPPRRRTPVHIHCSNKSDLCIQDHLGASSLKRGRIKTKTSLKYIYKDLVRTAQKTFHLQYKERKKCMYERNTGTRLCNHCCSGKAISVTYSEGLFVALGIQHVTRMRRIAFVVCLALHYSSTSSQIYFCTVFTTALHLALCLARPIQTTLFRPIIWNLQFNAVYLFQD